MVRARLRDRLLAPTPTTTLVVFRVALGLLGLTSALRFLAFGWVDELFAQPRFFFPYYGLGWLPVASAPVMKGIFAAIAVLGGCVALGLFTRPALIAFGLAFAYVNLCDVTNYLNHYMLVLWLTLLASLMPLGRAGSLDARRHAEARLDHFPAWCTYLLRFQVGVVYFHAGLAKCNADWLLHAQPLAIWLRARTSMPLLGPWFTHHEVAIAMSWAGFLYDTSIPFWLSWRRTRLPAYLVLIVFHGLTQALFPIGMFPSIMVLSALVFFPPEELERFGRTLTSLWHGEPRRPRPVRTQPDGRLSTAWLLAAALFCAGQALLPLRHFLYGGNVAWHEQGMRFAWKVMLREKNASVTYRVHDPDTGRTYEAFPHTYLTPRQQREFATQPDMILALAHHVAEHFQKAKGVRAPAVYADTWVSLNGRPKARLIDPNVDLTTVRDGLGRAPWILPAPDTLPHHFVEARR